MPPAGSSESRAPGGGHGGLGVPGQRGAAARGLTPSCSPGPLHALPSRGQAVDKEWCAAGWMRFEDLNPASSHEGLRRVATTKAFRSRSHPGDSPGPSPLNRLPPNVLTHPKARRGDPETRGPPGRQAHCGCFRDLGLPATRKN